MHAGCGRHASGHETCFLPQGKLLCSWLQPQASQIVAFGTVYCWDVVGRRNKRWSLVRCNNSGCEDLESSIEEGDGCRERKPAVVDVSICKNVELPEREKLWQPLREPCSAVQVAGGIVAANGICRSIGGMPEAVGGVLSMGEPYARLVAASENQGQTLEWRPGGLGLLCQAVCRFLIMFQRRNPSVPSIRKEGNLDLHSSLTALSTSGSRVGIAAHRGGASQELAWVGVAGNVLLARLLGCTLVFVVFIYRDKLGDPYGLWMGDASIGKDPKLASEVPPVSKGSRDRIMPVSVPSNPVSRFKRRRKVRNTTVGRASSVEEVSGRAEKYKRAAASDTLGMKNESLETRNLVRSQGSSSGSRSQARGNSGEPAAALKKNKHKKRKKGKQPKSSVSKSEMENGLRGAGLEVIDTPNSSQAAHTATIQTNVQVPTLKEEDFQRREVVDGGTTAFGGERDVDDATNNDGCQPADKLKPVSKQIVEERSDAWYQKGPDAAEQRSSEISVSPGTLPESNLETGDSTPDWIRQMVNARERWISESKLTSKKGALMEPGAPVKEGSAEAEVSPSVASRIHKLHSKLFATQTALQSSRVALAQSHEYLNEIHSTTSEELVRASDALEFREDELSRTIGSLRDTTVKLKAKALSMEVMEEQNNVTLHGGLEQVNEAVLKRTAKIVWPNPGREVAFAGSFNGWTSQVKMRKSNAGVFVASLELYPGRYEIKFVVDGSWRVDPHRPIVYEQGIENNVLIIS